MVRIHKKKKAEKYFSDDLRNRKSGFTKDRVAKQMKEIPRRTESPVESIFWAKKNE
jgi:hypothetical protein